MYNLFKCVKKLKVSFLIRNIFFTLILLSNSIFFNKLNSEDNKLLTKESQNKTLDIDYFDKNNINNYILGAGDVISIIASRDYPELSSEVLIDVNGTITLNKLKNIYVEGLTIKELSVLLRKAFLKYIKYPDVEVNVVKYRKIKTFVKGEVESPGLHKLAGSLGDGYYPTVFDALRTAGGITRYSNLAEIKLLRKNPISDGGGYKKTNLDFENTLLVGDFTQNIRIYDGDIIEIQKLENPNDSIFQKAIYSNINKKFIKIFISGRIRQEGEIEVSRASSLNDAILAAGGVKAIRGPISFIRFNNNGTITKKTFRYSKNAKIGSNRNPSLKNGDIIYIGDNLLTTSGEIISEITSPFSNAFSAYGLYKAITN
tara:strand:- start:7636 stop:8748 length:1113 start_codon:yes stop_codon:yes gene_type:complete